MTARSFVRLVVAVVLLPAVPLNLRGAEDAPSTLQETFNAEPGGKLVVRTDRGSVTITGTKDSKVSIEVSRKVVRGSGEKAAQLLRDHQVTFNHDGNTVRIDASLKRPGGWSGWLGPQLEVEVTVAVPREYNLDVDTAGGSVRASDVKGDLVLKTSGGSIHLEALTGKIQARTSGGSIKAAHVAGTVDLHTSGGSIRVEDARGERLKVGTSGGSLHLTGITVPAEAHTSGGSITVESSATPLQADTSGGSITAVLASAPKEPVTLKTSAGGITLTLPDAAAFNLDASTSAGGVHSEFPIPTTSSKSEDRSSLKGPANGGGPLLKLRTSAGSIRVKKG